MKLFATVFFAVLLAIAAAYVGITKYQERKLAAYAQEQVEAEFLRDLARMEKVGEGWQELLASGQISSRECIDHLTDLATAIRDAFRDPKIPKHIRERADASAQKFDSLALRLTASSPAAK